MYFFAIFVVSTKCIDLWVLEFVVSHTASTKSMSVVFTGV